MINFLPEKDMAMVEERIKRLSKTRPPPGSSQQPEQQQQQQQQIPARVASASNGGGQARSKLAMKGRPNTAAGGGGPTQPHAGAAAAAARVNNPNSSPSRMRPVSGAFTLDLDKIDAEVEAKIGGGMSGGRINRADDINEVLNAEPVVINPDIKARLEQYKRKYPRTAYANNDQQQQQQQPSGNCSALKFPKKI